MRRRSLSTLVLATAVATAQIAALVISAPAQATVPITQVAKLRDQAPVSGTYDAAYKNYGERVCLQPRGCATGYGRRVARGTLNTRLNAYVIKEEIKKYDFYLLDVDTALTGQSGSSELGAATIRVHTNIGSAALIDTDDSKSIDKDPQNCESFPVSVGAGWGVASAGIEVGAVTFCDDTASYRLSHSGADAVYTANRLPKIRHLTASRIVKVKRGAHPRFTVRVTVPFDDCTAATDDGWCLRFDDGSRTYTYKVGTTP